MRRCTQLLALAPSAWAQHARARLFATAGVNASSVAVQEHEGTQLPPVLHASLGFQQSRLVAIQHGQWPAFSAVTPETVATGDTSALLSLPLLYANPQLQQSGQGWLLAAGRHKSVNTAAPLPFSPIVQRSTPSCWPGLCHFLPENRQQGTVRYLSSRRRAQRTASEDTTRPHEETQGTPARVERSTTRAAYSGRGHSTRTATQAHPGSRPLTDAATRRAWLNAQLTDSGPARTREQAASSASHTRQSTQATRSHRTSQSCSASGSRAPAPAGQTTGQFLQAASHSSQSHITTSRAPPRRIQTSSPARDARGSATRRSPHNTRVHTVQKPGAVWGQGEAPTLTQQVPAATGRRSPFDLLLNPSSGPAQCVQRPRAASTPPLHATVIDAPSRRATTTSYGRRPSHASHPSPASAHTSDGLGARAGTARHAAQGTLKGNSVQPSSTAANTAALADNPVLEAPSQYSVATSDLVDALRQASDSQQGQQTHDARRVQLWCQQVIQRQLTGDQMASVLISARQLLRRESVSNLASRELAALAQTAVRGLGADGAIKSVTDLTKLGLVALALRSLRKTHTPDDFGLTHLLAQQCALVLQSNSPLNSGLSEAQRFRSVVSVVELLGVAPKHWLTGRDRRQLISSILPDIMRSVIHQSPSAASVNVILQLSKVNLKDDPTALLYLTAILHAHRTSAPIGALFEILYSYGSFADKNTFLAASLCSPAITQLANAAQAHVHAQLQPNPRPWVWPPVTPPARTPGSARRSLSEGQRASPADVFHGHLDSTVSAEDSDTDAPSFDTTLMPEHLTPRLPPVLCVSPHTAPGQPLHWQDAPLSPSDHSALWMTSEFPGLGVAGAPREATLRQALSDNSQFPVLQWLGDIWEELRVRVAGSSDVLAGNARNLARAVWGCSRLRFQSEAMLFVINKARAPIASMDEQSLSMICLALADLHYQGRVGAHVQDMAEEYASKHLAIKEMPGFVADMHSLTNILHSLAISDQPGGPKIRELVTYLLKTRRHIDQQRPLSGMQATQIAQYLTVLRELEWERARPRSSATAGGGTASPFPLVPPTLWSEVPKEYGGAEGLLPWEDDVIRRAERQLLKLGDQHPTRSHFQDAAVVALRFILDARHWHPVGKECQTTDGTMSADIVLSTKSPESLVIVLEADGPWHYMINEPALMTGGTVRRLRALARRGYWQLLLPYWEWSNLTAWYDRAVYLRERLRTLLAMALPAQPEQLLAPPLDVQKVWDTSVELSAATSLGPTAALQTQRAAGEVMLSLADCLDALERTGQWEFASGARVQASVQNKLRRIGSSLLQHVEQAEASLRGTVRPRMPPDHVRSLLQEGRVPQVLEVWEDKIGPLLRTLPDWEALKDCMQSIQQVVYELAPRDIEPTAKEATAGYNLALQAKGTVNRLLGETRMFNAALLGLRAMCPDTPECMETEVALRKAGVQDTNGLTWQQFVSHMHKGGRLSRCANHQRPG